MCQIDIITEKRTNTYVYWHIVGRTKHSKLPKRPLTAKISYLFGLLTHNANRSIALIILHS